MAIVGFDINDDQRIMFIVLAIVAAILCVVQFRLVYTMKLVTVMLLPFISFCICYENVVLSYGSKVDQSSLTAIFANIFQSFQIPLMIVVLYETTYRLFEIRTAHFICIAFDQGSDISKILAMSTIWVVRVIAVGLYIMNMFVDFSRSAFGKGGYEYLDHGENDQRSHLWLALIPPIVLSTVAVLISFVTAKYGNNVTINLTSRYRWRFLFVCTLFQIAGEIFPYGMYSLTSNTGELILLVGITYTAFLIEEDLALTGTFADYLHRSNIAFDNKAAIDKTGHVELSTIEEGAVGSEGVAKSRHNSTEGGAGVQMTRL